MKKLTLAFILIFTSSVFCSAATLIVDSHFPRPAGVYATIQLAHDAASPGDTILVSPAPGTYAGITVTKKVHIIGTGWGDASASVPHTKIYGFTFSAGAQGSSITGFEVDGMFDINTDSITVRKNKLQFIYVRANSTNVVIIQNFIISGRSNPYYRPWNEGSIISIWKNT